MSQNDQSQKVVLRFYEALDRLKADGVIRGVSAFVRIYGVNAWKFATQRKEPWLGYLVNDFGVSPTWFLLGQGRFYAPGWTPEKLKRWRNVQKTCAASAESPKKLMINGLRGGNLKNH